MALVFATTASIIQVLIHSLVEDILAAPIDQY